MLDLTLVLRTEPALSKSNGQLLPFNAQRSCQSHFYRFLLKVSNSRQAQGKLCCDLGLGPRPWSHRITLCSLCLSDSHMWPFFGTSWPHWLAAPPSSPSSRARTRRRHCVRGSRRRRWPQPAPLEDSVQPRGRLGAGDVVGQRWRAMARRACIMNVSRSSSAPPPCAATVAGGSAISPACSDAAAFASSRKRQSASSTI